MYKIEDIKNKIICGDCLEVMKTFPENSIDTVITDPPYGIGFMGKEWDNFSPSQIENKMKKDAYRHRSAIACERRSTAAGTYDLSLQGKMGFQNWMTEIAKEMLRVTKPGGTMLIFGGTRTWHRLACAIEEAGWIIKDTIIWIYGSGFPKATDISQMLDKDACRKQLTEKLGRKPTKEEFKREWEGFRKVIGINRVGSKERKGFKGDMAIMPFETETINLNLTKPTTPEAQLWNGWKSHGLKPAWEPIIMAMKPNEGSYCENAIKHGVAGLNINEARIGAEKVQAHHAPKGTFAGGEPRKSDTNYYQNQGRFPSNLILQCICDELKEGKEFVSGSFPEERGETAFFGLNKKHSHRVGKVIDKAIIHTNPECPCYMLDKQSGDNKSSGGRIGKKNKSLIDFGLSGKYQKGDPGFGDIGGASRFFYVAKASRSERNLGCERLEKKAMTDLDKIGGEKSNFKTGQGKERDIYLNNPHPTVKPLKLMEHLCILTKTPTGGIILDPFCGSGTTLMAAKKIGRDFIGIEKEPEYCKIAEARLKATPTPLL